MEAARTGGGSSQSWGTLTPLVAIAACAIGGVSLSGGTGKGKGIIIGVLALQTASYILVFIGLNLTYQQIVLSIIIVIAIVLNGAQRCLAQQTDRGVHSVQV